MPARRVLIVGAAGAVGCSLVQQLLALADPPFIRGSTRDLAKAAFPPGIEAVEGDLQDPSSYHRLFAGIDCVFTYTTENTPWPELLEAAKEASVRRLVLLSSMTVEFDPEGKIAAIHRHAEDAIKAQGLEYTFLRPRNFSSNSRSFWAPTLVRTGKLWITYPDAQTAPISEHDMVSAPQPAFRVCPFSKRVSR